jgi:cytochrome c oxidase subunit 2
MMDFFSKVLHLPVLASENGRDVDNLIIYVHWLMAVLFVGWIIYFGYCLWRFNAKRNPKADPVGARSHFSSYVEVAVIIAEVILLAGFAIPMWADAANIKKLPESKDNVTLHIVAQQFSWNARYPGMDGEFGKQDMGLVTPENLFGVRPDDPKGKDDVQVIAAGEIHVPVNRYVICHVTSKDVIHSFKVIALRVTQDAIPGMRIPCWFKATKVGRYQINCAQLCGANHSSMTGGYLVVDTQEDYNKWIASKSGAATVFE